MVTLFFIFELPSHFWLLQMFFFLYSNRHLFIFDSLHHCFCCNAVGLLVCIKEKVMLLSVVHTEE